MMINQKKAGVIVAYLAQGIQILTVLIYTPVMLHFLGKSEYGLYQLVYSVVSYLSVLNFGFGSSYMRFYSIEKNNGGEVAIASLNGMFFLIFSFISVISIACGVVMLGNIRTILGNKLNESEYKNAQILMLFLVINLALSVINSVFNCIVMSQEMFLFQQILILLQNLLNPFLALPLLIMGYGSIGMVSVTTLLTLGVLFSNVFYCRYRLHTKFCFHNLRYSLLKEMWIFTFFIFLNQVIDQVNWSVDKYLLGRFKGTSSVAIYGIGGQINSLYLQISTSVSNVFIPTVNRIVADTDSNDELTELFIKVGRIQFMILIPVLFIFIIFGRLFIAFWVGNEFNESYFVAIMLLVPVTIPLIQNLGIEIQRAKNKHKIRSIIYFIISIANILISIPLIEQFGAIGAALGTAVALMVGNVLFMNWYYHVRIGLNIVKFWKSILKIFPALIVPCILGVYFMLFVHLSNILKLLISVAVYMLVCCFSIYCWGMNNEEKKIMCSFVEKIKMVWR